MNDGAAPGHVVAEVDMSPAAELQTAPCVVRFCRLNAPDTDVAGAVIVTEPPAVRPNTVLVPMPALIASDPAAVFRLIVDAPIVMPLDDVPAVTLVPKVPSTPKTFDHYSAVVPRLTALFVVGDTMVGCTSTEVTPLTPRETEDPVGA